MEKTPLNNRLINNYTNVLWLTILNCFFLSQLILLFKREKSHITNNRFTYSIKSNRAFLVLMIHSDNDFVQSLDILDSLDNFQAKHFPLYELRNRQPN